MSYKNFKDETDLQWIMKQLICIYSGWHWREYMKDNVENLHGTLDKTIQFLYYDRELLAKVIEYFPLPVQIFTPDGTSRLWYYVKKKYKLNVNFSINMLHILLPFVPFYSVYPSNWIRIHQEGALPAVN